jgi:hypothetical protein
MNCEKFQTVVNDLAREQMMEASERASAQAHVAECDSCASSWEEERSLTAGLRTLADEMKLVAAPPQIEARVLAAFRDRGTGTSTVKPVVVTIHPRRPPARYWVAAIAALLLVVFGIFVVRARVLSRSQPQFAGVEAPAPTAPTLKNDQRPPIEMAKNPRPVNAPRRNDERNQVASNPRRSNRGKPPTAKENTSTPTAKDEIATGFFPLTYGGPPNLQEGGQMLRVELSRDAVARFGLPVNMDRTGERVKADVLVGSDGLAQAIRFVH